MIWFILYEPKYNLKITYGIGLKQNVSKIEECGINWAWNWPL